MIFKVKKFADYKFIRQIENLPNISSPRRKFLIEIIFLYLGIKGRMNFLQFNRYGEYCEKTYRDNFETSFDFLTYNRDLVLSECSNNLAVAFDPSYIAKSGKHTPNIGRFWSGCANTTKHGLEISGIAAVDLDNNTAMHLEAVQTPNQESLRLKKDLLIQEILRKDEGANINKIKYTLLDHYADIIVDRAPDLLRISKILLADAYFSKNHL